MLISNEQEVGKKLAKRLGEPFVPVHEKEYPDTERMTVFEKAPREKASVIYFSFSREKSFDSQLFSLLSLLHSCADPRSSSLVLPYLPYCRSFPAKPEEVDRLTFILKELKRSVKTIYLVSPHGNVKRLHALAKGKHVVVIDIDKEIVRGLKTLGKNVVLVSPDKGFSQSVERLAKLGGMDHIVLGKRRISPTEVAVVSDDVTTEKIARHKKRTFVVVDDIVSTGNTLRNSAAHLRSYGVEDLHFAVIHDTRGKDQRENMKVRHSNSLISDAKPLFDLTESIYRAVARR